MIGQSAWLARPKPESRMNRISVKENLMLRRHIAVPAAFLIVLCGGSPSHKLRPHLVRVLFHRW